MRPQGKKYQDKKQKASDTLIKKKHYMSHVPCVEPVLDLVNVMNSNNYYFFQIIIRNEPAVMTFKNIDCFYLRHQMACKNE